MDVLWSHVRRCFLLSFGYKVEKAKSNDWDDTELCPSLLPPLPVCRNQSSGAEVRSPHMSGALWPLFLWVEETSKWNRNQEHRQSSVISSSFRLLYRVTQHLWGGSEWASGGQTVCVCVYLQCDGWTSTKRCRWDWALNCSGGFSFCTLKTSHVIPKGSCIYSVSFQN